MRKPTRRRITVARYDHSRSTYAPVEIDAYVTSPESRFAVHRMINDASAWTITHIASGLGLESVAPDVGTLTRGLQIIVNWESKGMDMSVLDDVTFGGGFKNRADPRIRTLIDFMRKGAAMEPSS